jgi:hypothetical protein
VSSFDPTRGFSSGCGSAMVGAIAAMADGDLPRHFEALARSLFVIPAIPLRPHQQKSREGTPVTEPRHLCSLMYP